MSSVKSIVKSIASVLGRKCPGLVVRIRFLLRFHRFPNLRHPKDLNEKIQYLSLKTDTSLWTELTDKFKVREYIRRCGLEDTLVPLLGHWSRACDIDFDSLPSKFVLKCTHGSGDCIIVRDKSRCDREGIVREMQSALDTCYGLSEGNIHYSRIVPSVVAESLVENDAESAVHSSSLIDYKVWCFNGKAHYIWACTDRSREGAKVLLYDTDWNDHPEYSVFTKHYMRGTVIPKPANLDRMLEIAETLARPFPVVRVDLYNVAGKVYFGEMTFTSLGGYMDFYTDDFLEMTGSMINLDQ